MSAAPWKKYNRLQDIAEHYKISIDELLHLASQGRLVLYGCLPPGVYLRKGPGGDPISAQFVRLSQVDAQKLELHGQIARSQFDTAISIIDGICIEHDSVGRQLVGLVNSLFNRFCTKDGSPVTFVLNDIYLIHEKNLKSIVRDDLWRGSVLDRVVRPDGDSLSGTNFDVDEQASDDKEHLNGCAISLSRQAAQEQEILRVIAELGFTAKALPKWQPGKSGVKAEVRAALARNSMFQGGIFDKAWERLRSQKDIQDSN